MKMPLGVPDEVLQQAPADSLISPAIQHVQVPDPADSILQQIWVTVQATNGNELPRHIATEQRFPDFFKPVHPGGIIGRQPVEKPKPLLATLFQQGLQVSQWQAIQSDYGKLLWV